MTDHDRNEDAGQSHVSWLLLILIAFLLLAIFVERFVLVPLAVGRLLLPLLLALAAVAGIAGTGAWCRRLMNRLLARETPSEPPGVQYDFLIGYPIFGALFFLLGLITTSEIPLTALFIILVIASAPALRFNLTVRNRPVVDGWIGLGGFLVLVVAGVIGILSAQLPASTLDELAYHLAVPMTWITEGRVVSLPLLSHSWFPLGIESADLPLLAILGKTGALASHFLHLFSALATLTILWTWVSVRSGSRAAWIAVAAVASTPALLLTAGWSWNEWPLLGITIALIVAMDHFSEGEEGWAGASSVALAAGLLTKYTFVPLALAILAAAVWRRTEKRGAIGRVVLGGVAIGSVFFLRNLIAAGNPVAPFFSAASPDVSNFRRASGAAESLLGYLFDGRIVDEALGISLPVLAIAFWLFWRMIGDDRFVRALGVLMTVLTLALLLLFPSSRILVPSLVVLAVTGTMALDRRCLPRWNAAIYFLVGIACVLQLCLCAYFVSTMEPFSILSGRQSEEQYLTQHRSSYAAANWVNSIVPRESRTLVIGVNELFWFDRPVRGGGNFDGARMDRYLGQGMSGDLIARLRRDGITHVAVFPTPVAAQTIGALRVERETTLSAASQRNLAAVLSASQLVGESAQGRLYALPTP